MAEAVEICKLRLFLKLASQLEPDYEDANLGIEPLPDVDFNIRVGNAIVGFVRYDDVEKSVRSKLDFDEVMSRIARLASEFETGIAAYREQQIGSTEPPDREMKSHLQVTRATLQAELNQYLARDYVVDCDSRRLYDEWLNSHRPFHWFIEYHDILSSGGFDVIIGNPPYIEHSKLKRQYQLRGIETLRCGNSYAYVIERCQGVIRQTGRMGMIVQLSMVCTARMQPIRSKLIDPGVGRIWVSNFDDRPARLFDGLQHIRASIWLLHLHPDVGREIYSTRYIRWRSDSRERLFSGIGFEFVRPQFIHGSLPKIGDSVGYRILDKITKFDPLSRFGLVSHPTVVRDSTDSCLVYFHTAPQYWVRVTDFVPWFRNDRGDTVASSIKALQMRSKREARAAGAVLNSTLFYWWFLLFSDCRNLIMREIESFPVGFDLMSESDVDSLGELMESLMHNYRTFSVRTATRLSASGRVEYDEFHPKYGKSLIDQIDLLLAAHFGLVEDELDYILNYDIGFRRGA